jgi:protein-disulfide isomerase
MTHEQRTQLWVAGIFLVVIVAITAVAAYVSSHGSPASSASFTATQTSAITSTDHTHGDATAKVTLIEYGDFECPACGAYEPLVEQLYQQYKGQVLFVFRNFPLYQIHPFAMIGAQAAEAANLQGQYWQMHDLLYSKQSEWTADTTLSPAAVVSKFFNSYAQSLGLNVTQFDTDINSDGVKAKVQADLALGNAAQIDHTPTFFINLTQIANPTSLQDFQNVINAAIASSTGSTATIPTSTTTGAATSLQGATSTTK